MKTNIFIFLAVSALTLLQINICFANTLAGLVEPVEHQPSEPVEHQPAEPVEHQTVDPEEHQPSEPVEHQSNEPVEHQTNETVEHQTVEPVKHQSAEPVEHQTAEPVEHQTAELVEHQPAEPVEQQSAEPVEHQTAEPVEHQTTEPVDYQTAEPVEHQTAELVEHQPAEPVEHQTAEPVKRLSAEPVEVSIVGGDKVSRADEIPWQVAILTQSVKLVCGGSILKENWILTAAHCSTESARNYLVRAGSLKYASGGTLHSVSSIRVHENYQWRPMKNDIAVWKVFPAFNLGSTRQTVILPTASQKLSVGTVVTVSGWGQISNSVKKASEDLMRVKLKIVDKKICDTDYGRELFNEICAGQESGEHGACDGDSGGPLFVRNGVQHGIVSRSSNECGRPQFPGIYTEVTKFRNWINNNINN